ncbi:MAG: 50S ribosomal protein L32e [Candidatus Pacearchaeota archaeon]|nr:50S ribosomal protein L32e [Candidatus Pacearchaeota archaeon]
MKDKKFLRVRGNKKIRLGKRNKKKQTWRRARGKHNKTRESTRGKAVKVKIGFRKAKMERNKIKGKIPFRVNNFNDLKSIKKENIAIIAKLGKKKRQEIETKLKELGIEVAK